MARGNIICGILYFLTRPLILFIYIFVIRLVVSLPFSNAISKCLKRHQIRMNYPYIYYNGSRY